MASVSSLGVGSNLKLGDLLDDLTKAEQGRLTPLTTQQSSYKAKLTAWSVVQSSVQKVQSAAEALSKAQNIATTKVTSTNKAFTATIDANANAAASNYSVEVTQLAQAQSLVSGKFDSKDAALSTVKSTAAEPRTLVFTQGTGDDQKTMKVSLSDDQTSLTAIRDAVNKQQGGVTASIIQADDNSFHLSFTARDTGEKNAMTIAVTGDDELQAKIGYDKAASTNGMEQKVAAKNAELKINDIAITRSSNTITGAPEGITLNLTAVTEADKAETLTVTKDTAPMKAAVKTFVDAYNSLQTTIDSQTKYTQADKDSTTQNSSNGDLLGDGTLRGIQTQIRSLLSSSQSGEFGNLASLGLTQDISGRLSIDDTQLDKALNEKPASVTEFFIGDGEKTGFGVQVNKLLTSVLASDGAIKNATNGIDKSLKNIDDKIKTTNVSINSVIERYKKQFTELDKMVNQLTNTGNYLTKQFEAMSS
ncbi:flagellar filament capping protein FliD [Klebsiella sp. BIGb0407]|uniref:flagellar filament capping protein FliD n=1 Tax=Klebsiella sp. BIGb0407 TaxID=2940603 RepID=UPI002168004F|nr:flagellar filament capping protein FliD [Klebsiella sp. BIGb0407]MCS3431505.1 flagellar hook-associated protein 2 [Klebsiella sp. BIGb0407]